MQPAAAVRRSTSHTPDLGRDDTSTAAAWTGGVGKRAMPDTSLGGDRVRRRTAAALLVAMVALTAGAQEPAPPDTAPAAPVRAGAGVVDVTVVSLAVVALDRDGRPVLDLAPDELTVHEDGEPVRVLGLERGEAPATPAGSGTATTAPAVASAAEAAAPARPWRVVTYIATELAGRFVLSQLCQSLAEEADTLAGLGPVDVVLADPTPAFVTRRNHRPADIRAAIETVADQASGMTTVEQIRRSFTAEFKPGVGFDQRYTITQSSPTTFAARARSCVNRERTVIRGELDRLVAFIQSQPPTERGVLIWLTGGFDLNPADFYLPLLEQIDPYLASAMRSDYPTLSLEPDVNTLIEVALSYGWVVVPVNLSSGSFAYGAEVDGTGKSQHLFGVGVNSIEAQGFDFQQVAPNYPLQVLASATGGELVVSDDQLHRTLESTAAAYQLSYQVDRPTDGLLHRVEIATSRPDVRLLTRRSVASGSLRGVATARAERRLAGEELDGGLVMGAALGNVTDAGHGDRLGDLQVRAALGPLEPTLAPLGLGRVRVTVVVANHGDPPFVHHQEIAVDWSTLHDGVWYVNLRLKWPKRADQVAVVAEELVSGTWGVTVVPLG